MPGKKHDACTNISKKTAACNIANMQQAFAVVAVRSYAELMPTKKPSTTCLVVVVVVAALKHRLLNAYSALCKHATANEMARKAPGTEICLQTKPKLHPQMAQWHNGTTSCHLYENLSMLFASQIETEGCGRRGAPLLGATRLRLDGSLR